MEYQKIIDDAANQPSRFRRNWVEITDESRETYNESSQIKFKTSLIRPNLCNYGDAYIHVKGIIQVGNNETTAAPNNRNKKVIFQNCAPFITCTSEINITQVDDAHDIDVVIPMYNLIEYIDTYLKTSGRSWQYYRDETALSNNSFITDFAVDNNNSNSIW